jgi:hypothetical protein
VSRRFALLAAAAAVLGGCGADNPHPHLQRADAAPLLALAQRIATEHGTARSRDVRRLRGRAIALVNAHRVPAPLQETFMSRANALPAQSGLFAAWLKKNSG